jgi:structural maintenance of chromosome 4
MFELADRLVGIYKTHDATKSVTINPRMFAAATAAATATACATACAVSATRAGSVAVADRKRIPDTDTDTMSVKRVDSVCEEGGDDDVEEGGAAVTTTVMTGASKGNAKTARTVLGDATNLK